MNDPGRKTSLVKRLLLRIFPSAPDFYSLLNDQCELAVDATGKLVDFMNGESPEIAKEIRRLEHEGDKLKARNMDVLNRSFSTLIDRDDIYRAISSIDEIVNYAKSTVRELEALRVVPDAEMAKMAGFIHEGTKALCRGYAMLSHDPKGAEAEALAAHKSERRTEKLYRKALSRLFDDTRLVTVVADAGPEQPMAALREVVRIFRQREIYRHLSNAADHVALAGEYLHDTIVKAI